MVEIDIDGREIGDGHPTFIIAEAGINHNGDIELAKELVDEARAAGADAIKFQTYDTESRVDTESPLYDTLKQCELRQEEFEELFEYCQDRELLFFSTPFDVESVALLDELGVPIFKVASFHITHKRLLRSICETGKPIIFSRGMASEDEIIEAIEIFEEHGIEHVVLHCVSSYPTEWEDANLNVIRTLREKFDCPVGYSDHTLGTFVPSLAVAVGATVLEKHFTLDTQMEGPDHSLSAPPDAMTELVDNVREVEMILGSKEIRVVDSEEPTMEFRKETS